MNLSFLMLIVAVCLQFVGTCEPDESQHGCNIYGVSCICGYGCKKEYVYKSRRACMSALRARSSNVCHQLPCLRGICVQTMQEPGFSCKCEGSGFFGFACEKNTGRLICQPLSRIRWFNFETVQNPDVSTEN